MKTINYDTQIITLPTTLPQAFILLDPVWAVIFSKYLIFLKEKGHDFLMFL